MDWWRDRFFLWRRRCYRCKHRRPAFLDGECFDCCISSMHDRVWLELAERVKKLGLEGILYE